MSIPKFDFGLSVSQPTITPLDFPTEEVESLTTDPALTASAAVLSKLVALEMKLAHQRDLILNKRLDQILATFGEKSPPKGKKGIWSLHRLPLTKMGLQKYSEIGCATSVRRLFY
jgi:hypothetical protein